MNFLPQIDQKVHQVPQNLPQAFCFGDAMTVFSRKKLYISENLFKNNHFETKMVKIG